MPIIVYDIIALALIAYFACSGYRTGFFLTLCNCIATIVAFAGALFIVGQLAQPLADILSPVLQMPIEAFLEGQLESTLTSDLSAVVAELHDSAILGGFVEQMDLNVQSSVSAISIIVAQFVALQIARIVLFLAGFFVVMMLWFTVSRTLNLAFRLPILSGVNALAGLGVGLVQGLLMVFLLIWVLQRGILTAAELESTYLLTFFLGTSPIALLESAVNAFQG